MAHIEVSTAPSAEPISVPDAAKHVNIDIDDDNAYLQGLIEGARTAVEDRTNRCLITQTIKMYMDSFPSVIKVPRQPIQSVDSITYTDSNEETQTLDASDYTTDITGNRRPYPPRIEPAYGEEWPTTLPTILAVTVTLTAGYGDTGNDVPQSIRQAMKLMIGHWYEHRMDAVLEGVPRQIQNGIDALLAPHVVYGGNL